MKRNIRVGAGAIIGDWAKIGDRATIGDRAKIGVWATIGAEAKIGDRATIGDRAKIGAGATIGAEYGCLVLAPLGSRQAPLTAYLSENTIWVGTGCFLGPIDAFERRVRKVHSSTRHATEYLLALKYIREKFARVE